ncbi:hypothetical protein AX17_002628 [Amanita inopinata Kibby_2008]|nr:hypothetical protein AX17_002628 [Amanita inopinata Kibby_2008]
MSSSTTTAASENAPAAADGFDNLVCKPGTHPGWQIGYFQYDVPAKRFFDEMDSFYNAKWYLNVIRTSGPDNTVGAVRTVTYTEKDGSGETVVLDERLIHYVRTENKLEMYWTADEPVTFPYKPHGANFESYVEGFTVRSIGGGTATYMSFSVNYTTKTVGAAYHFATDVQREAMAALSKKLGAQLFLGTCPS